MARSQSEPTCGDGTGNTGIATNEEIAAAAERLDEITVPEMFYVCTTLGEQSWLDGHNVLVSAGTAWRNPGKNGAGEGFDIHVPDSELLMVDSGGYQAAVHYDGEYPYPPRKLFEWAEEIGADFVAGMDWACEYEDDLRSDPNVTVSSDTIEPVPERIEKTIEQQVEQAKVYDEGDWSFEFMPVVQGYSLEDYQYCARRLRQEGVARKFMGVGSVCKRDDTDQIHRVLQTCKEELWDTEFHLFGATRRVWKETQFWGEFASGDTHAWGASHPDGGWPEDKQEKREAFEHFRDDIQSVQRAIDDQEPIAWDDSTSLAKVLSGMHAVECACGTNLPLYGANFEPGCRHCQGKKLSRELRDIHDVDTSTAPRETHVQRAETTTQPGLTSFSD